MASTPTIEVVVAEVVVVAAADVVTAAVVDVGAVVTVLPPESQAVMTRARRTNRDHRRIDM